MGAERDRVAGFGQLEDGLRRASDWHLWGPYVIERQRGTVREDYSADGGACDRCPRRRGHCPARPIGTGDAGNRAEGALNSQAGARA